MLYERIGQVSPLGINRSFDAVGVAPGASVSAEFLELLRDIPSLLQLPQVGVSTPWAGQVSDFEWKEIHNPDTNIQTFSIRDNDLANAATKLFGNAFPFLILKTLDPVPVTVLKLALSTTGYELFETQAVYRQDDPNPVPRIEFFHWIRFKNEGGGLFLEAIAQGLSADLLYGQQVPVGPTTVRSKPVMPFIQAFNAQFLSDSPAQPAPPSPTNPFPDLPGFPGFPTDPPEFPGFPAPTNPTPPPVITPSPPPVVESPPLPKDDSKSLLGPVLVFGTIAAFTVFVMRSRRSK